jgi:hypothetical protein
MGRIWAAYSKGTNASEVIADIDAKLAPAEENYRGAGSSEADDVAFARKRVAEVVATLVTTERNPLISVEAYGSYSAGQSVSVHVNAYVTDK